jgi:hypothetical protein
MAHNHCRSPQDPLRICPSNPYVDNLSGTLTEVEDDSGVRDTVQNSRLADRRQQQQISLLGEQDWPRFDLSTSKYSPGDTHDASETQDAGNCHHYSLRRWLAESPSRDAPWVGIGHAGKPWMSHDTQPRFDGNSNLDGTRTRATLEVRKTGNELGLTGASCIDVVRYVPQRSVHQTVLTRPLGLATGY